MLFVPQHGELLLKTELGHLSIKAGEIAVIPRGIKFQVQLLTDTARGYICENYGHAYVLAERGPVGANGYANDRDFQYPVAAFEDIKANLNLLLNLMAICFVVILVILLLMLLLGQVTVRLTNTP